MTQKISKRVLMLSLATLCLAVGLVLFAQVSSFETCGTIVGLGCADGHACYIKSPVYPDKGGVCIPESFPWTLIF